MTMTAERLVTEMVEVARPRGVPMGAYLARPAGAEPVPGVVIIHEIFGLNDNIRGIARRFAEEGYAALAVDLFSTARSRRLCLMRLMVDQIVRPLHNPALRDLAAAVEWLRRRDGVDPARTGTIGFCMGGSYAVALACVERNLRAASVFYGLNPWPMRAVRRACPIVGSYGEDDPLFRRAGITLDRKLTEYDIPHDIKIYPGAGHSFCNANPNPDACEDALARTFAFFGEHLGRAG